MCRITYDEIVIYITCGFIFGFILYLLFKKKDSGVSSVLSTQLSELSRRFTVLEEAAKNMETCNHLLIQLLRAFKICLMINKKEVHFLK